MWSGSLKARSAWDACLPERRSFVLPRGSLFPRWWVVPSVAAHFVVLTAVVKSSLEHRFAGDRANIFLLAPAPPAGNQNLVLSLPGPSSAARRRARAAGVPVGPGPVTAEALDTTRLAFHAGGGGSDTTSTAASGARSGRDYAGRGVAALQPALGSGAAWVRPLIDLTFSNRPIHLDSAVAVRMRAMADSVEKHPVRDPYADPYTSRPWTFKSGGKTYGLDAQGLHLGSFTIPTVLLAFLSMPQGNIDQARANNALMGMRADILRAAARAESEDAFRQAVRDLRARKDKERQDQPQPQQPAQP